MITLEVQLFFYINSVEGATVQYLFLKIPNSVLVCKRQEVEDAVTDVVVLEVIHHVSPITLRTCIQRKIVLNVNSLTLQFVEKFYRTGLSLIKMYIFLLRVVDLTLTCSLEVTAQKTISVKPWVGNILKQMPPITLLSFTRARHLCFLQ